MESLLLLALLVAPIAMLAVAVRVRRAREAGGHATSGDRVSRPWDKQLRNGMLLGIGGVLLLGSGLFAYSRAAGTSAAPLFALPVIAGVVLSLTGYRTWMRGVASVPDDAPRD